MHHIATGDASFDKQPILWYNIQGLRLDLFLKVWYNEAKKDGE
jgi:hypothetical protein